MACCRRFSLCCLIAMVAAPAYCAVDVAVTRPKVSKRVEGRRFEQSVTLANEVTHYTLTYDIIQPPDKPGEIMSHYWGWQGGWVTLGMTGPSKANWYWQGFFNWHFDGESLYNRRAKFRVVRTGGGDGLVEYVWDTPKAKVTVHFALTTASDKLLMFGHYEPKQEIKECYLRLSCYPATFSKPHNRAVTTAAGTTPAGGSVSLGPEQRWALYEDTTEGRPADGPAGLLVGRRAAFKSVSIPVAGYGIVTRLELKPDQRSFALGLYSFPAMPDVEQTREYFRAAADREARWLGQGAGTYLDQALPPLPAPESRRKVMRAAMDRLFERPVERWRARPESLRFAWARPLARGAVSAVVLCPRWCAYETMELARRLEMTVRHVYFDSRSAMCNVEGWPYRFQTGIGSAGLGAASIRAAAACADPKTDVFLCAGVAASALPGGCQQGVLRQVREGKGLVLVASGGWPKALFEQPEPETAAGVLSAFPWSQIPGYREGERGRVGTDSPLSAYRYGKGRVLVLKARLNTYSSLVPRNDAAEGLRGATDRCLALCAKAALAAVGSAQGLRLGEPDGGNLSLPVHVAPELAGGRALLVRVQDDLDRDIAQTRVQLPLPQGRLALPALPAGRSHFVDVVLQDGQGRCIDFASARLPAGRGVAIESLRVEPSTRVHEAAVPRVELPNGGQLTCRATVQAAHSLEGARMVWEVRDAFGRVLARKTTTAPAGPGEARAVLSVGKPVTVCHVLDVSLQGGKRELAFARQRFTMPVPFPYDDFTVLMWSYAGGDPVLQQTNRLCYEMGADMMDICHMIGYSDAGAAREYSVAARSGLRLLPYVTRIAGQSDADNCRVPCLHDPAYMEKQRSTITICTRQAEAYGPVAFTLGDENYLFRGDGECCHRPESVAAFRRWLEAKYTSIAALNRAWRTNHESFAAIDRPMLLADAAKQDASFAPWIDHKRFMDSAFAAAHERLADVAREQVPGAKVGWDGLLGYTWRAGYDFAKLTANLELNQTYVQNWLQGSLVRSFKRADALVGKWGNSVADNEAGWSAWPWHGLFLGDNSVWWWTSWGCDYIPFSPDVSFNDFGRWFFAAVREVKAGPGKLLLHAKRSHSRIGVLYSQPDVFASVIMKEVVPKAVYAGDRTFLKQHTALLKGITDLGYQFKHISYADLERGELSNADYDVVFLTLASCLSDNQATALGRFVEAGGTLVVDGRAGLLTGAGAIRDARPLDAVMGVRSAAGLAAVKQTDVAAEVSLAGALHGVAPAAVKVDKARVHVLEPRLGVTTGQALGTVEGSALLVVNTFGKGRGITLNFAVGDISEDRAKDEPKPLLDVLDAVLRSAGLVPPCELARADGSRPLCIERVLFTDGRARYLALEQELMLPDLPDQQARIKLPRPEIVYDVRAGQRVGKGRLDQWDVKLSRGRPLVYSLMPYEVLGVAIDAPSTANRGMAAAISVRVKTGDEQQEYHVVRLNVYAPGSREPHRQYSQNVACPAGKGQCLIPFALNDALGSWRIEARDVASGLTGTRSLVAVD